MMDKHYHVVCAVVENNGQFLCMQKGATKFAYTSYHWEFPGGKIENGETPGQALHRELLEEMDYDVEVGQYITTVEYHYPDFAITMDAYLCHAQSRQFVMKEHAAFQWLSAGQMQSLEWCAADAPIAAALAKLNF